MNRPLKIFLWVIAGLAAVFAVAAVAFLFLFDANDFKEDVERAVTESTGRELVISGDVSVQIFPWLAVEIGEPLFGRFELAPADDEAGTMVTAELGGRVGILRHRSGPGPKSLRAPTRPGW